MAEYQPRKQLPQVYPTSHNLAQQPYSLADPDDLPLDEEANVVPLPKPRSVDSVAEDPLQPRSPAKRKQSNAGKGRSTTSKKASKTARSSQAAKQTNFADELQQLEAMADRINQILAERSQRNAWSDPSRTPPRGGQPSPTSFTQPYPPSQRRSVGDPASSPLEDEKTENLKLQAQRIRQRLSQLEAFMETVEEESPADFHHQEVAAPEFNHYQPPGQSSHRVQVPNFPVNHPVSYGQFSEADDSSQSSDLYQAAPSAVPKSEYEAWLANEELRRLKRLDYPTMRSPTSVESRYQGQDAKYHEAIREAGYRSAGHRGPRPLQSPAEPTMRRYVSALRRSLHTWHFFDLPQRPGNYLADAIVWIAAAVVIRVSSRYFLLAFPFLTPVLTLLMLTPAAIALLLALFVPRIGWVPLYRLFLITLGLFVGGKF